MRGKSFVPEIRTSLHDAWLTSDLRFATELEAQFYVMDLMICKPVALTRVVASDDPPTHVWLNSFGAVHLPEEVG